MSINRDPAHQTSIVPPHLLLLSRLAGGTGALLESDGMLVMALLIEKTITKP